VKQDVFSFRNSINVSDFNDNNGYVFVMVSAAVRRRKKKKKKKRMNYWWSLVIT
jgi:hypothetical protein